jgi:ABC-2 type transport system ATP-binding protein
MIETKNLSRRFKNTIALDGVTLAVEKGMVFGLIGPNGAGKTTMLRILATIILPTAGTAKICGLNIVNQKRLVRRKIGFMPDALRPDEEMTAFEYLDFYAAACSVPYDERRIAVTKAAELAGLTPHLDRQITEFERGLVQRLSLARAIVHEPEALLLDEPSAGLDPRGRAEFKELIKYLAESGKTILYSSHLLSDVQDLTGKIGILDSGKLVADGSMAGLVKKAGLERVVRAKISGDVAAAAEMIRKRPDVSNVETLPDGVLEIELRKDSAGPSVISAALLSAGFGILEIEEKPNTLEQVFIALTNPSGSKL